MVNTMGIVVVAGFAIALAGVVGDDNRHLTPYQVHCHTREPIMLPFGPSETRWSRSGPRCQPLSFKPSRNAATLGAYPSADAILINPITGMGGCWRARHERHGRSYPKSADEMAPSHSITSSARPSRDNGTVTPGVLAQS